MTPERLKIYKDFERGEDFVYLQDEDRDECIDLARAMEGIQDVMVSTLARMVLMYEASLYVAERNLDVAHDQLDMARRLAKDITKL